MAITRDYQSLLTEMRRINPNWGRASRHALPVILELAMLKIDHGTILDYGAGTGQFKKTVEAVTANGAFEVTNYEPGVPQWSALFAGPYDAVVCTHVLEHVEPELLKTTIDEIKERARHLIYIEVPHGPATKILPDGRNAHLTQQSRAWWHELLIQALDPWPIEVRPGQNSANTQFIARKPAP